MPQLRLALAQVDPTVGDLPANADIVRAHARRAADAGAHLLAFPEMVLTGYPVEDLALRTSFVDASRAALTTLARDLAADGLGDLPVVVGYLDRVADQAPPGSLGSGQDPTEGPTGRGGQHERGGGALPKGLPQNCAAVLHGGTVVVRYAKHFLPTYGVFDEFRVFVPGDTAALVRVRGVDVALAICEDLWQDGGPVAQCRQAGAELLLVINGSPFELAKDDARLDLARRRAAEVGCPLAYLNMVGGQDDLVFDGGSLVVAADGTLLARAPQFEQALVVLDVDCPVRTAARHLEADEVVHVVTAEPVAAYEPLPAPITEPLEDVAAVWAALVLGLHDYVRKNGFSKVALGLSGGIDSSVVAAMAVDALGAGAVTGLSLPSGYSSAGSRDDADDLARRLGCDYRVIPIAPMVEAFGVGLADAVALSPVAQENLQARVRGTVWMALSNSEGHLVLVNSNKSELSVGYSTLYGDAAGGFAPIKDVPKMLVWELARWRNAQAEREGREPPIPRASITKVPSAELSPGQTDQDSLPPYELLDDVLEHYVVGAQGRSELLGAGFDPATVDEVVTLVDRAEWKRRQFAPGPKISAVAFGRDRRLPITSRWRESESR